MSDAPAYVTCRNCGLEVPPGHFCGRCGARLTETDPSRRKAFAAAPAESVLNLNLITTLFPHLPHRRGGPFRWALVLGALFVLVLLALHLYAPAATVATCFLPALYLLYLYEVEVYENEPWLVIGATMVIGGVLGFTFANFEGQLTQKLNLTGDSDNAFLLSAVATPLVGQVLMLAGPLLLFFLRRRFTEPLDGLSFGAASALGFTVTSALTALGPLLSGPLIGTDPQGDWALRLLRVGLLVSIVNASTTGMITASLWLHRHDRERALRVAWPWSVLTALVVALGAQLALGMLSFVVPDLLSVVVIWAAAAALLLLYMRLMIHHVLLEAGSEMLIGPDGPCPECRRVVPAMAFCPACGVSRLAAPKQSRHQPGPV
jgi:RsiW-degrading membrane proteinase PrsW (M82 family)